MTLFKIGNFRLHSGRMTTWKIDCDSLTDSDWETLALMISQRVAFSEVYSVPTGGDKLASALERYGQRSTSLPPLVVDDVLTTGGSIKGIMAQHPGSVGWVVFARGPLPPGVSALFSMSE